MRPDDLILDPCNNRLAGRCDGRLDGRRDGIRLRQKITIASTMVRLAPRTIQRLRNPLLEPRPWIFYIIFGNFGGSFWPVFAHPRPSRFQKSIPDGLTDLRARNESSGACLGPNFWSFSPEVRTILDFLQFQI